MKRWIDLDELLRDIVAEAKARALVAGLEGVTVRGAIAEPDKRERRAIDVEVQHVFPGEAAACARRAP